MNPGARRGGAVPASLAVLATGFAYAVWPVQAAGQAGGSPEDGAFAAWVALYDPPELLRLENENRIDELCGNSTTMDRCYADAFAPSVVVHALRAGPRDDAESIGELVVVAVPGRGFSTFYLPGRSERPADGEPAVPFTPDLWLADWGYGPYFHQTVVARDGDWFRLPPGPWENEVWMKRTAADEMGLFIEIRTGEILEMDGSGYVVLSAEREALVLRAEQPADMWCESGDVPTIVLDQGVRWTRDELSDARGHLRFTIKYLKGC